MYDRLCNYYIFLLTADSSSILNVVAIVGGVKCAVEETGLGSSAGQVIQEDWTSSLAIGSNTTSNSTWRDT